jgi:hypothetical protein
MEFMENLEGIKTLALPSFGIIGNLELSSLMLKFDWKSMN